MAGWIHRSDKKAKKRKSKKKLASKDALRFPKAIVRGYLLQIAKTLKSYIRNAADSDILDLYLNEFQESQARHVELREAIELAQTQRSVQSVNKRVLVLLFEIMNVFKG